MRIILTRHGQTVENAEGRFIGHLPGKLSELGKEQARKLAHRLKDEKIDYIYSSDLARAADTAKEIAKYHPNAPIKFVRELREKCVGELEGKKIADFGWDPKELKAATIESEEGETTEELYERAKNFLSFLMENHPNDTVLLAGHNGINVTLTTILLGKGCENINDLDNLQHTGVSVFETEKDGNWKMQIYNCTKHLE
jgi:broad specificity phosphatase PhoE